MKRGDNLTAKIRGQWASFLIILVLLSTSLLTIHAESKSPDYKDSVEVEINLLPAKNHFLIRGKINGKTAYFLLDTGSSYTVLHSKAAKRFNFQLFRLENSSKSFTGANSSTRQQRTNAINVLLDLGQPTFSRSYVAQNLSPVVDHVYQISHRRIAGIIGSDFLKHYGCSIDLNHNMLRFK